MKKTALYFLISFLCLNVLHAQYKSFFIGPKGDTLNAVTNTGLKVGKWKDGFWRRYTDIGDLLAVEKYKCGGKDGVQQYFSFLGGLEHEEEWRGYNPDAPYDTIPIYGTGSGEILEYKVVKAETYSVKHGEWRYYDPGTGKLLRKETWNINNLVTPNVPRVQTPKPYVRPEKVEKPKEVEKWEQKNKGKKVMDGRTSF
jgi:hypothetical protein